MRGLANRRLEEIKAKQRIRKRLKLYGLEDTEYNIGTLSSVHGSFCSCYMCGNPRKYYGERTIQEKKHDYDQKQFHDMLEEIE